MFGFMRKSLESENSHPHATRWPWQHSQKAPQEKQLNCEHRRRYITGVSPPARAGRRSALPSMEYIRHREQCLRRALGRNDCLLF